jgi:D-sedoheptulose 7-phosphate isomerase
MQQVMGSLRRLRSDKNTLYIMGNGGSAAVASHAQVDFVNVAKINAQVLHESSLITCMANDFGYEQAYSRVLAQFIKTGDVLIAISSSGQSKNIGNAAQVAKERGVQVVTFTGFNAQNPLRQLGDFNFWLDSNDYGYVEVGHQSILHNLSDRFGVEHKNTILEKANKIVECDLA